MWSNIPDSTKWTVAVILAFLALLDPGFLMIPYNIWHGRKAKKDKGSEEK